MDINEAIVQQWLTRRPDVFVSAQYSIDDDWSRPDFVALYFEERVYAVVEVSAAYDVSKLAQKVRERHEQWLDRLSQQLQSHGVIDGKWSPRVEVFIRKDRIPSFANSIGDQGGVEVFALEDIGYSWQSHWYE